MHDLLHGLPARALWRALQHLLTGIGQWPPAVARDHVRGDDLQVAPNVPAHVFHVRDQQLATVHLRDEDVVVANVRTRDGLLDLRPNL
jgi:hypothetical protein